jgi:F-type H+-transporting ATPase subunit delta
MAKLSRRQLAAYAAAAMADGQSSKVIAPRLAAALIANKKSGQLEQLIQDIAYELEERRLAANALVSSAGRLNPELLGEVKAFIAKQTGAKEVSIEQQIDPSLIGGIQIETAKQAWNQTIKRRLTDIREAF